MFPCLGFGVVNFLRASNWCLVKDFSLTFIKLFNNNNNNKIIIIMIISV